MDLDKWTAYLSAWLAARHRGEILPLSLPSEHQNLYGLTLLDALESHEAWLHNLELTLRGQNPDNYDPDVLAADDICTMGSWLHGEGRILSRLGEYARLKEAHKSFHKSAAMILNLHRQGRFAEAIRMLRRDLVEQSKIVERELVNLQIRVWRLKMGVGHD